jgi:cytochrome c oxidase subunit 2
LPPGRLQSRRRAFAIAFAAALLLSLALASAAFAGAFTPESGPTPNAHRIDDLYKITLYIAIVIFVGVEGALVYSLIKFRARKGAVAAQIRGNTRLEVGWTVGAALILVALATITFVKLSSIKNPDASSVGGLFSDTGDNLYASVDQHSPPGGKALTIEVNGQQFIWSYLYPNGARAYEEMVVPINTTVVLDIKSQDVVHSWWIPKLGGKFMAVPGYTNKTWFKISKPGVYHGQCSDLCGRGHADMVADVRAVPVDQYKAWLSAKKQQLTQAQSAVVPEEQKLQANPQGQP